MYVCVSSKRAQGSLHQPGTEKNHLALGGDGPQAAGVQGIGKDITMIAAVRGIRGRPARCHPPAAIDRRAL